VKPVFVVVLFAVMGFIQTGFDEWERHRREIERQDAGRASSVGALPTQEGRAMGLLIYWSICLVFVAFSCISMTMRASGRSAPVYGVAQEPTVAPLPTRSGRA
jgi:hypothetical protein